MGAGSAAAGGADSADLRRLGAALVLSLLLHGWLVWGVPARLPRAQPGAAGAGLHARLAQPPAAPSAQAPQGLQAAKSPRSFRTQPEALSQPQAQRSPDAASEQVAAGRPSLDAAAAEPASEAAAQAPPLDPPSALEVPLAEAPEFLPARMLDVLPRPVQEVALPHPEGPDAPAALATVTLLLLIDELGMVVEASVVDSDPPGEFDNVATEAFRATLFLPGQRDGRPVKSRLVVEVVYGANGTPILQR